MRSIFILILAFTTIFSLNGQDFSGTYEANTASGQIILSLSKNDGGGYTGSLSGNNNSVPVAGQVTNGQLKGKIGDPGSNIIFSAGIKNQVITFTMADADQNGNINQATSQVLTFLRAGSTAPAAPQTGNAPAAVQNRGDVRINNITLSGEQIRDLVSRYGIEPKPGNYWYDSTSGLFGVYGYPSYGFMYPGHNFGQLSRDASGGNTGVLINGRELPQQEWAIWSYMIGYYVQPGSYWFQSNGNVGYEGNNMPVLNMFVIARQNSYSGKGSGGDNFWSSRFGAGNSNSDNSQGYVSVPGYGPVGYGF
jgi:hypothetical protein